MKTWFLSAFSICGCICACSVDKIPKEYQEIGVPETYMASTAAIENGHTLFQRHCALCHGSQLDGEGSRSDLEAADFTSNGWRTHSSPRWMFYIIREGKSHSKMLGLKNKITEMETWDIIGYILSETEIQ